MCVCMCILVCIVIEDVSVGKFPGKDEFEGERACR